MPLNGKSHALVAFVAVGYVVVAGGYWLAARHSAGSVDCGLDGGTFSPSDAAQRSSS